MKFIRSIFALLFCPVFLSAEAQNLNFGNISPALNLPSMECYGVMQDQKGYIWISTEAGLCRYNGTDLKMITGRDSLPRETVYAMEERPNGGIWMLTSQNRILYYYADSLRETPFTTAYRKLIYPPHNIPYRLSFTAPGEMYVHSNRKTIRMNLLTGQAHIVVTDSMYAYLFEKRDDGLLPVDNDTEVTIGMIKVRLKDGKKQTDLQIPYLGDHSPSYRTQTCRIGQTDFFSLEGQLVRLEGDSGFSVYPFPNRILSLYVDPQDGLWVGVLKGGVYYFPDVARLEKPRSGLDRLSVTGVWQDREKNIWCSTLEKGIFRCPNKTVIDHSHIRGLDETVDLLKRENGRMFVSSPGIPLAELSPQGIREIPVSFPIYQGFTDIVRHGDGWLFAWPKEIVTADPAFRSFRLFVAKDTLPASFCNRFVHGENGRLFGVYFRSLIEIKNRNLDFFKLPTDSYVRDMIYVGRNRYLLGSQNGLYTLDYPFTGPLQPTVMEAAVTRIIRSKKGLVWVATKEGLFVFRDSVSFCINRLLNIPAHLFFDVAEDRNGHIWAASNEGLVHIYPTADAWRYRIYSVSHGLPSPIVRKVATDDTHIYVSTSEGLCAFPLTEELGNTFAPSVYPESMLVNEKPVDLKSGTFVFPHQQNSLRLSFDVLTYKGGTPRLSYRLDGSSEGDLREIAGNVISLENLPPDTYTLTVYAENNDGLRSEMPAEIRFTIRKPFWLRAWFIAPVTVLLFLAGYAVFRLSLNRVRRREEEKTRIHNLLAESRLSALQAQMNPHFIFNAINSIQNYILQKKEEDAYTYLAKFGKLIRMVLNQSREKTIPLQRELETVALYVELEQLRFRNRFEYRVTVAPGVDEFETDIPVMLIQPYIENAIWHGFMNLEKKQKGLLTLDISIHEDVLRVTIEDNGIGRKRSVSFRKEEGHSPVGTAITEQRLGIINRMQGYENTHITVTDLYENGKAAGTRVEIRIPVHTF